METANSSPWYIHTGGGWLPHCRLLNGYISFQKFLQSYGYIPEPDSNGYSVLSASHLQKAIKTMQRYANIPQTGVLDSRTMKVMRLPRCGIPDVASTIHNRTIRHKRFIAYGPKWDKFPLTWRQVLISQMFQSFSLPLCCCISSSSCH